MSPFEHETKPEEMTQPAVQNACISESEEDGLMAEKDPEFIHTLNKWNVYRVFSAALQFIIGILIVFVIHRKGISIAILAVKLIADWMIMSWFKTKLNRKI